MLFRVYNLIALVALTAFVVNGHGSAHHEEQLQKRTWYPQEITSSFSSCQTTIINYGPTFETACQENRVDTITGGLVDLRTTFVTLSSQVHASVGAWVGADLHALAVLFVGSLAKLEALLAILQAHNRIDPCREYIVGLSLPLRALLTAFVTANIDMHALLAAQVDLRRLASFGCSLGF
jgi:hypothetical protein